MSADIFRSRGGSSVKAFSFLNLRPCSTCSLGEVCSSSKRRSRGPVMALKKASEGVHCYSQLFESCGVFGICFDKGELV